MGGTWLSLQIWVFLYRCGKGSPSSTAAQSAPSAHSEVTHPLGCGLAAWCKLALAKLEVHEGMLGFEYGEIFRVREDIKISFILVGNIWNFILELNKFKGNLQQ